MHVRKRSESLQTSTVPWTTCVTGVFGRAMATIGRHSGCSGDSVYSVFRFVPRKGSGIDQIRLTVCGPGTLSMHLLRDFGIFAS